MKHANFPTCVSSMFYNFRAIHSRLANSVCFEESQYDDSFIQQAIWMSLCIIFEVNHNLLGNKRCEFVPCIKLKVMMIAIRTVWDLVFVWMCPMCETIAYVDERTERTRFGFDMIAKMLLRDSELYTLVHRRRLCVNIYTQTCMCQACIWKWLRYWHAFEMYKQDTTRSM
jgi:hypothetical protein